MKQWIPACAGMTVLKEIKLKKRRHPRDGGDPLRSGCFLRLTITHPCHRAAQPRQSSLCLQKIRKHETVDTGLRRYDE